ncbi:MAG TPA: S8 family serine peptidase, partial [Candidatus Binatia bacterium]|nr:S8 family serine peptidase [Candidatus Binatia bacterium]
MPVPDPDANPVDAVPERIVLAVSGPQYVIIELRQRPLLSRARLRAQGGLRAGSARLATARQQLAAEHDRVLAAMASSAQRRRGRSATGSELVRRRFVATFNGIAATLTAQEQDDLRSQPDVAAIHEDAVVEAVLDVSAAMVAAPQYRIASGNDGTGATVAVIDTGIDHTHTDLGGCLGPACKVRGGYDFVDDDPMPQDGHGHGTHVAGIVASSHPSLPGVAPGASLLAYRVLDDDGYGLESDVMAGIERAIDPDDDGDTSDRADVLNLSLGGDGDADSPLAQAADNATAAGAVVVAAAGNRSWYSRILSPGSARSAVTVGATGDNDVRAVFSSRGPNQPGNEIKPEISAPGVAVCAPRAAGTGLGGACHDAEHVALSGTSMATPHVAGAAALLRAADPVLTPAQVKSMLIGGARDVGAPIKDIGAGVLDIAAAAAAPAIIEPATLSFGLDDLALSVWSAQRTLLVRNTGAGARDYVATAQGLPAGVTITLEPAAFSLA